MQEMVDAYNATATAYADRWFDVRLTEDMARFASRLGSGTRVLDVGLWPRSRRRLAG